MGTHKDLDVWKLSILLVTNIYEITKDFPKEEQFGIVSQMRRAAVSIPSNLAEGAARDSIKEYIRFIQIGMGSLSELDTQLIISKELGYLKSDVLEFDLITIRKKLYTFRNYLKKRL